MRILAFETSAKAASVALLEGDMLLGELYLNCGLTHSRTLLESAQRLLEITELTAKDIDAVACAAGPGSFTGVRIGVAAAKALHGGGISRAAAFRRWRPWHGRHRNFPASCAAPWTRGAPRCITRASSQRTAH